MSGRTRNMAADAAHLAGLGAGPSGSASGHRAHRRLRAEQGRAASGALERSRLWPWRGASLRSESLGAVAAVWRPQADMGQTQASMRIAPQLLAKLVALDLAGRRARQIVGHFEPPRPLVGR